MGATEGPVRVTPKASFGLGIVVAAVLGFAPTSRAVVAQSERAEGKTTPYSGSEFVGSATCRSCHAVTHSSWTSGRHSRMLQAASPASVIPAFGRSVRLHGKDYALERSGDAFYVVESYMQDRPTRRKVDYTLGSRRVQHYLSRLDDGRIVVLPPSWDVEKKEWFHNLDIVDLEESGVAKVQVWNTNCFGCHVSGQEKRFDPATKTYATSWTDFGTACERCHGPGRAHATAYRDAAEKKTHVEGPSMIVHPARLNAESSTALCAQCHSLRDITQPGFVGGADYFDHFTPILEYAQQRNHDPAYWPDGRPRRFSNDAIGFWQSQCFSKGGATCVQCHEDVHEPDVDRHPAIAKKEEALCLSCHAAIARDTQAHSKHEATTATCASCHMPRTVISLRHRMPDHTISVPAPNNTERHRIPNACNECHKDQTPRWAESKIAEWFPGSERRRRLEQQALAFSLAAKKERAALSGLVTIATDADRPPIVRANALGHMRAFDDPLTTKALLEALRSKHPAIRTAAVLSLAERGRDPVVRANFEAAVLDPRRSVRMGAAIGLVNSGVRDLGGAPRLAFDQGKREHRNRAAFMNDDATAQIEIGKLLILSGDFADAAKALEAARTLDMNVPGGAYFLALARLGEGRDPEALRLLRGIPKDDPHRAAADAVLKRLGAES